MESMILTLAVFALPVVFAITLHEAAHGYVARHFGDPTAWQLGRVSLNPLRHIDPVGTILVPVVILLVSKFAGGSGILFGWAKPVPVNFGLLRNPKQDMLWVAAAGPASNLVMGLGWAMLVKWALLNPDGDYSGLLWEMGMAGLAVNASLMVLNLLPVPPLDGGRIAISLLPMRAAMQFAQLERYGLPILLILLFAGVLERVLSPLMKFFLLLVKFAFGI